MYFFARYDGEKANSKVRTNPHPHRNRLALVPPLDLSLSSRPTKLPSVRGGAFEHLQGRAPQRGLARRDVQVADCRAQGGRASTPQELPAALYSRTVCIRLSITASTFKISLQSVAHSACGLPGRPVAGVAILSQRAPTYGQAGLAKNAGCWRRRRESTRRRWQELQRLAEGGTH